MGIALTTLVPPRLTLEVFTPQPQGLFRLHSPTARSCCNGFRASVGKRRGEVYGQSTGKQVEGDELL